MLICQFISTGLKEIEDDFQQDLFMTGHENTTAPTVESNEPLFEDAELVQFDADDTTAGRALCKMLSLFFLYTVIVMAIAGFWTYSAAFGS